MNELHVQLRQGVGLAMYLALYDVTVTNKNRSCQRIRSFFFSFKKCPTSGPIDRPGGLRLDG